MSHDVLAATWIASAAAFSYLMLRNRWVRDERLRVLDEISRLCRAQIAAGDFDGWQWRYAAFDEITYDSMMFRFWRPINSFFVGHPVLS